MMLSMSTDNVRLNYTISQSTDDQLQSYRALTGRTASDLVRQLVSEVLEGDRPLPSREQINQFLKEGERRDQRTDMWMSARYLAALDTKLEEEEYPSKSGVIAYLLDDFLNARANHADAEMVRVSTFVDRLTYMYLVEESSKRLCSLEEVISALCKEAVLPSAFKTRQNG